MVISFFQRLGPDRKIEKFYTTGTQKQIHCFNADGFLKSVFLDTVFEAMVCFYQNYPCQEARYALFQEDIQRGTKKGNR